jgi:hypothetical protein
VARHARSLGGIGIAGVGVAVLTILALHLLEPGLGPVVQPLSFYARGTYAWLWMTGLSATAVAALALAVGAAPHASRRVTPLIVALTGVCLLVVALFPTDVWFPWERRPTFGGAVHSLATALAVVTFAVAMLMGLRLEGVASVARLNRIMRTLGFAYVATMIISVAAVAAAVGTSHQPRFVGLVERILLGIVWLWLLTLAAALVRVRDAEPTRPGTTGELPGERRAEPDRVIES